MASTDGNTEIPVKPFTVGNEAVTPSMTVSIIDGQGEVGDDGRRDLDGHVRAGGRPEPLQAGLHSVLAWWQGQRGVAPLEIRRDRSLTASLLAGDGDVGVREGCTAGVPDGADHSPRERLGA